MLNTALPFRQRNIVQTPSSAPLESRRRQQRTRPQTADHRPLTPPAHSTESGPKTGETGEAHAHAAPAPAHDLPGKKSVLIPRTQSHIHKVHGSYFTFPAASSASRHRHRRHRGDFPCARHGRVVPQHQPPLGHGSQSPTLSPAFLPSTASSVTPLLIPRPDAEASSPCSGVSRSVFSLSSCWSVGVNAGTAVVCD